MSSTSTTGRPQGPEPAVRAGSSRAGQTSRASRTSRTSSRRPAAAPAGSVRDIGSPASQDTGAAATALLDPPTPPREEGAGRARRSGRSTRPRGAARAGRAGHAARARRAAPRHRLLLACTAALAAGLVGVLFLNTVISQGAFRQHELEVKLILLSEQEEALNRALQQDEAPLEVERRARALGMVPAGSPVFLRLSDGRILGTPVPAPTPTGPVDFADAPGLQPTPSPTPSTGSATAPTAAEAPSPGALPGSPTPGPGPAAAPVAPTAGPDLPRATGSPAPPAGAVPAPSTDPQGVPQ